MRGGVVLVGWNNGLGRVTVVGTGRSHRWEGRERTTTVLGTMGCVGVRSQGIGRQVG
jgi:hypothetical protein